MKRVQKDNHKRQAASPDSRVPGRNNKKGQAISNHDITFRTASEVLERTEHRQGKRPAEVHLLLHLLQFIPFTVGH